MVEQRLFGRRALVTGGSRGIGAATAQRLAAEGAAVVVVARSTASDLSSVVDRIGRIGTEVYGLAVDLSDQASREDLVDRAASLLGGPIDILVNNAAAAVYQPLATYPLRRRRLVFEANLHAPVDLIQQALPAMLERGAGWIVNVSSSTARPLLGPPFHLPGRGTEMAVYGASKAALNRITNGLAAEVYGSGIRINTIEPRFAVLTEGARSLVDGRIPTSGVESIEEMVEGLLALCDCAESVTGRTCVSLDLIADLRLEVRDLFGQPLSVPG